MKLILATVLYLLTFSSTLVAQNLISEEATSSTYTEEEMDDFCIEIAYANFQESKKLFYSLILGDAKRAPSQYEMNTFWEERKESLICPDPDDMGDEEHFLKKAVSAMNLEFIKLLGAARDEGFGLDMNFSIDSSEKGVNSTLLDLLLMKQSELTADFEMLASSGKSTETILNSLKADIKSLDDLIGLLKANGALTQQEIEI